MTQQQNQIETIRTKFHLTSIDTIKLDNVEQKDLSNLLENINTWDLFTFQQEYPQVLTNNSISPNQQTFHSINISKPKKYSLMKTNDNEYTLYPTQTVYCEFIIQGKEKDISLGYSTVEGNTTNHIGSVKKTCGYNLKERRVLKSSHVMKKGIEKNNNKEVIGLGYESVKNLFFITRNGNLMYMKQKETEMIMFSLCIKNVMQVMINPGIDSFRFDLIENKRQWNDKNNEQFWPRIVVECKNYFEFHLTVFAYMQAMT